ncbi:hypothetical protein F0562_006181 [Nyssa sinensis]|uniref:Uncharacterized protein n=1 Tax=Nyssa sinensis TaxID=561372 RepID=A0A5J5AP22_9ASTE|nr:hypothetical protein F0562_006181 [Nyssa sinensis]
MENCQVPKGCEPYSIVQNISFALIKMNYCGPVSISAYGDDDEEILDLKRQICIIEFGNFRSEFGLSTRRSQLLVPLIICDDGTVVLAMSSCTRKIQYYEADCSGLKRADRSSGIEIIGDGNLDLSGLGKSAEINAGTGPLRCLVLLLL